MSTKTQKIPATKSESSRAAAAVSSSRAMTTPAAVDLEEEETMPATLIQTTDSFFSNRLVAKVCNLIIETSLSSNIFALRGRSSNLSGSADC